MPFFPAAAESRKTISLVWIGRPVPVACQTRFQTKNGAPHTLFSYFQNCCCLLFRKKNSLISHAGNAIWPPPDSSRVAAGNWQPLSPKRCIAPFCWPIAMNRVSLSPCPICVVVISLFLLTHGSCATMSPRWGYRYVEHGPRVERRKKATTEIGETIYTGHFKYGETFYTLVAVSDGWGRGVANAKGPLFHCPSPHGHCLFSGGGRGVCLPRARCPVRALSRDGGGMAIFGHICLVLM